MPVVWVGPVGRDEVVRVEERLSSVAHGSVNVLLVLPRADAETVSTALISSELCSIFFDLVFL